LSAFFSPSLLQAQTKTRLLNVIALAEKAIASVDWEQSDTLVNPWHKTILFKEWTVCQRDSTLFWIAKNNEVGKHLEIMIEIGKWASFWLDSQSSDADFFHKNGSWGSSKKFSLSKEKKKALSELESFLQTTDFANYTAPYDSSFDRYTVPGWQGTISEIKKYKDHVELAGIPIPTNVKFLPADTAKISAFFKESSLYYKVYRGFMNAGKIDSNWLNNQQAFWFSKMRARNIVARNVYVVFFEENNMCMMMRLTGESNEPPLFNFFEWPQNVSFNKLKNGGVLSTKAYVSLTKNGTTDLLGLWKEGQSSIPKKYRKTVRELLAEHQFDVLDWGKR